MRTKRKTKGKVNHKRRVRFCSLDYYRQLVTGKSTDIAGIKNYVCTDAVIRVQFESGMMNTYFVNEGEEQLKQVIKIINAYIGGTGNGAQQQFA